MTYQLTRLFGAGALNALLASMGAAQTFGDSVRVRGPSSATWLHGRIGSIDDLRITVDRGGRDFSYQLTQAEISVLRQERSLKAGVIQGVLGAAGVFGLILMNDAIKETGYRPLTGNRGTDIAAGGALSFILGATIKAPRWIRVAPSAEAKNSSAGTASPQ